jgi:hypothetical protein
MAFIIPAAMLATAVYGAVRNEMNQSSANDAANAQQDAQNAAAARLRSYAPVDEAARVNVMQNSLAGYEPANRLAGKLYGGGAQVDLNKMGQDPFKGTGYQAGKY